MANQLGKRYACQQCGSLILCVRRGDGVVVCCDIEMALQAPPAAPLLRLALPSRRSYGQQTQCHTG